jgi:hypothetical protein
MVMPAATPVYASSANPARHPAFPQGGRGRAAALSAGWRAQSWEMSCAHTAIIPTNSVIYASAAASSTKIFNISRLPWLERHGNIVPFLFHGVKRR